MHLNNFFNLIVIIVILAYEFFHVDILLALLFNFRYFNLTSPKNLIAISRLYLIFILLK